MASLKHLLGAIQIAELWVGNHLQILHEQIWIARLWKVKVHLAACEGHKIWMVGKVGTKIYWDFPM